MHKRQTMRVPAWALAAASACLGLAAPGAFAQAQAWTSQPVDLYAGPSGDYPVVSEVDQGVAVEVMGCVSDYSWCDIVLPGLRGWIYGAYLTYPYQGGYVPVEGYGAVIGLPVVTFAIGTYWGSFYRDRPWYGERDHWAHVPPPGYGGRPPVPPPAMHGGPGAGVYHAPPGAPHGPPEGAYHAPAGPGGPPPGAPHGPPEQGNAARPPAAAQEAVPRPSAPPPGAARPPAPAPQPQYAHPGGPPQQGYGRPPGPPPAGAMHAPGPAPGNAHPEPAHPSGHEEGGHGDSRQQN
jgi:uncharacterized protein YraI